MTLLYEVVIQSRVFSKVSSRSMVVTCFVTRREAYWKNHPALRMILMLVLFVLALVLVVSGWKMTGQLAGLGIMLVGVALLLAVLAIYNATYQD